MGWVAKVILIVGAVVMVGVALLSMEFVGLFLIYALLGDTEETSGTATTGPENFEEADSVKTEVPAGVAWAGTAGPEFQVNTYTEFSQSSPRSSRPSVGMNESGNFVVAWPGKEEGSDVGGIFAQCYDASGAVQGGEVQVNTNLKGWHLEPSVGMNAIGNSIIAWSCTNQDGDRSGVYAQRYDAFGAPQGSEFRGKHLYDG